ncbi:response regulator [Spirosoma terrae]|uniref:Response regulator n=1 Tax=Spirosoma terrae TaxID=1968276 RepID=A0A6L9LAC9_9BACT|nr:response regulator [Spirosoma terrae]NDU96131.1 response regulator [Spirosoma terrae]
MAALTKYEHLRGNFKRAKLLVIEDNDDHWTLIRNAINQSLPELMYVRASNSAMALELLQSWTIEEWELPKLILQDLYVPTREEGWNLVKEIKEMSPVCNRIPLVMFSSSQDPDDVNEAYQLGVSSYLVKPLDFSDWLAYFKQLRSYWWDTVTLPPVQFSV